MRAHMMLTAACVALLAAAAGAEDIMGPIGPVEAPAPRRPARRTVAALLAVGFVGVAAYWLVRRRATSAPPAPLELPDRENLAGLDSAEFYGRLLTAARESVSDEPSASTLTPRELARMGPPGARGWSGDRWRDMCRRAERARYAGDDIGAAEREEDLSLLREVLAESREGEQGR